MNAHLGFPIDDESSTEMEPQIYSHYLKRQMKEEWRWGYIMYCIMY